VTQVSPPTTTRRERQREATFEEIVTVSRDLLAEGAELSLRAVAGRMGLTAPALYRYVASYQDLVDLVAFEIDKAATAGFSEAASRYPDDVAAQLVAASVAFRRWAHASPREFSLVFANPIAAGVCVRRELLTAATSGLYFHALLIEVWKKYDFPHPAVDELEPAVAAALDDPVFPIDLKLIPDGHRGLLWVFMRAWAALYGVVTLEVFGHMDPRIIESGAVFRTMIREWIPQLGMADEYDRLDAILAEEFSR
jgi:AcrR family transcriptional regulator